jgi:hypothetical protein
MAYFNGSSDGYEKGYADGLAGSKYNPVTLKNALAQAIRPATYTDTFLEGYKKGWTDGNRKRNKV